MRRTLPTRRNRIGTGGVTSEDVPAMSHRYGGRMQERARGRAVVLGGGGVTGIAWELGVVAALAAAGIDLDAADLLVGTSAGATVAAQISTGTPIDQLVASQLTAPEDSLELAVELDFDTLAAIFTPLFDDALEPEARRAQVGALAVAADTVPEATRREIIEARLPDHDWPDRPMLLTAVDARTGAFTTFDRGSGVGLVDAVAASCAVPGVWPAVSIDGRRYVDGGIRSSTNADLADGHDLIVVLTPMGAPMTPQLDDEITRLEQGESTVVLIRADDEALEAMGPNPLDPTMRAVALAAGRRQGAAVAEDLLPLWSEIDD